MERIGSGLGFTEGPVWTEDGRLLVTSITHGVVYELGLDGTGEPIAHETGGGPNSLAQDADGVVWVAQNGGVAMPSRSQRPTRPGLQRLRLGTTATDGAVDDLPVDGATAPNDLAVGPDGRIWFTDPGVMGAGPGLVHVHDPRTGTTAVAADGLDFPNGLAFTADGDLLVAETRPGRILRFRPDGDALVPDGVFGTLPEGGPDGLALAADGRVLAATPRADRITVFAPEGSLLAPILLDRPTFPTNVCFAGPDHDVLVVTAAEGGLVLALVGHGPGLPLLNTTSV